ncbi:MAG: hypothetical protein ACI837_001827 [Crocinitomicaceae bacterium]|jgi:hypothetical protein
MEENTLNGTTQGSGEVILELKGIDKKWVRTTNGKWIDQRFAPRAESQSGTTNSIEINDVVEDYSPKKRWQFWKR